MPVEGLGAALLYSTRRLSTDPIANWLDEKLAEARARALLEANTSEAERDTEGGARLFGPLSGVAYHIEKPTRYGLSAQVRMAFADGPPLSFCVFSNGYHGRPPSDEVLAMVLYIKYDEATFLERAVPHLLEAHAKQYRAVVRKVLGEAAETHRWLFNVMF